MILFRHGLHGLHGFKEFTQLTSRFNLCNPCLNIFLALLYSNQNKSEWGEKIHRPQIKN